MNAVPVTTSRFTSAAIFSHGICGLVAIWAILRGLTSLCAALFSTLRPITALEQTMALWPLGAPWGLWLQRALRASYRIYVLAIVLVSFSYHTGLIHPYMGLQRHLFLAFPVFIGLGQIELFFRWRVLWVGGGFAGSCFLILLYVLKAWVT